MAGKIWIGALRALWASLPWSAGWLLGEALEGVSGAFATTAGAGAWALWAVGLTALLVPHTVSLTALRILAPGVLAATCWAAAVTGAGAAVALGLACGVATAIGALSPLVGDRFIDATSYGHERRLALRAPAAVLVGALAPTWALTLGGMAAGPLLWAAGHWVLGPLVTVAGWLIAVAGMRALHGLARRWLVYVPAGLVLHDRLVLAEPTLFRRPVIAAFGPAPAGSGARDFTAGAGGLLFELRLSEPVSLTPARSGGASEKVAALLVAPTRPAAVVAEARKRRIPTPAG
ncbi:MAG: hypothetical protein F4004_10120 [Acidimicrobiia bacterium]|nr:hypothetical protein [Acidimicrobiia bacterium]MYC44595.1 hypothetical protein [Acidimicrobiia bacterium]